MALVHQPAESPAADSSVVCDLVSTSQESPGQVYDEIASHNMVADSVVDLEGSTLSQH